MLKILGRITSINVRKVAWAADEMGLGYEREDWGLPIRDPNVPDFLALNPNAQVPVIIDSGYVLWESNAVMRYLAEKTGSGLWPRDAAARGLVDQWMSWQSSELGPAWSYAVMNRLRHDPGYKDEARVERSMQNWTGKMQLLDAHLAGAGGYVANGSFSLADIVIGLSTHRWLRTAFDKPMLPAVEAHYAAMRERVAGKRYLGETTP